MGWSIYKIPLPFCSLSNATTSGRALFGLLIEKWRFPIIIPLASEPGGRKKTAAWRAFFRFSMEKNADANLPFEIRTTHSWINAIYDTGKDGKADLAHVWFWGCPWVNKEGTVDQLCEGPDLRVDALSVSKEQTHQGFGRGSNLQDHLWLHCALWAEGKAQAVLSTFSSGKSWWPSNTVSITRRFANTW